MSKEFQWDDERVWELLIFGEKYDYLPHDPTNLISDFKKYKMAIEENKRNDSSQVDIDEVCLSMNDVLKISENPAFDFMQYHRGRLAEIVKQKQSHTPKPQAENKPDRDWGVNDKVSFGYLGKTYSGIVVSVFHFEKKARVGYFDGKETKYINVPFDALSPQPQKDKQERKYTEKELLDAEEKAFEAGRETINVKEPNGTIGYFITQKFTHQTFSDYKNSQSK